HTRFSRDWSSDVCSSDLVSTGIGGGLILDGRVRTGESGNAGHIGHLVVDVNGPECACGGRGCVEAIASGTSIARWAVDNGWQGRSEERRVGAECIQHWSS